MRKGNSTHRNTFLHKNNNIKPIDFNQDEELDKNCFDCGRNNPEFISINNGIFICELCVENHLTFGEDTSIIINNDFNSISKNELLYMYYGGNKKLYNFITKEFPSLRNCPRQKLYKTKALNYYRKRLNYFVKGGKEPIKPKMNEALEIEPKKEENVSYINNSFDEINYKKNNNDANTIVHTKNNSTNFYQKYCVTENVNNNSNDYNMFESNNATLNLITHHINLNNSFKKEKAQNVKKIYCKPRVNDLNEQKYNNDIFKRTFTKALSNKKKSDTNSKKEINKYGYTQSIKFYSNYINNSKNNNINYNINNYYSSSNLKNNPNNYKKVNINESNSRKLNKCHEHKKTKTNVVPNENNYIIKKILCFNNHNNTYKNKEKDCNEKQKCKKIKEIIIKSRNSETFFNTNRNTEDNTNNIKIEDEKYKPNKKNDNIKDIEINFKKPCLLLFNEISNNEIKLKNNIKLETKFKNKKSSEIKLNKNISSKTESNEENNEDKKLNESKSGNIIKYEKLLTEANTEHITNDSNIKTNNVSPKKFISKQSLVYVKTITQYSALHSSKKKNFFVSPNNKIYCNNKKINKISLLSVRYKNRNYGKNKCNKKSNLTMTNEDKNENENPIKGSDVDTIKRKHINSVPQKQKNK